MKKSGYGWVKRWVVLCAILILCVACVLGGCGKNEKKLEEFKKFAEEVAKDHIVKQLNVTDTAQWTDVSYVEHTEDEKFYVYVEYIDQNGATGTETQRYFVCVFNLDMENESYSYSTENSYVTCRGKRDKENLQVLKTGKDVSTENGDDTRVDDFYLSYNAGRGGTISGETLQEVGKYCNGTPVVAVANEHYRFVKWSDGVTTAERFEENVLAHLTVTAEFIAEYDYTFTAQEHGSVEGVSQQRVDEGQAATPVTAVPDEGYRFVRWEYESEWETLTSSNPTLTVSATEESFTSSFEMTFTAIFEKIVYSVSYSGGRGLLKYEYTVGCGDKNPNGYSPNGVSRANFDISIDQSFTAPAMTAVAPTGYRFAKWSDGVTTATRHDEAITQDITVTAEYVRAQTVQFLAGEGGTVVGETEQLVDQGQSAREVTAVVNAGYAFVCWAYVNYYGQLQHFYNPTITVSSSVLDAYYTTSSYKPSFTASFKKIVYRADYDAQTGGKLTYEFSATNGDINPNDYNPAGVTGARFDLGLEQNYSAPEITAVASDGYRFEGWSDGVTTATRHDVNLTENLDVTAQFVKLIKVEFIAGTGGSIEGESVQFVAKGEGATTVTAVADEGYEFAYWEYRSLYYYNQKLYNATITIDADLIADYFSSSYLPTFTAVFTKSS